MYDEQCRKLILNVLQFMEKEKNNLGPIIPLHCHMRRAAEALGICEKTLRTIQSEKSSEKECPSGSRPKRLKNVTRDLPQSQKIEIRNALYQMYSKKIPVTLKSLHSYLSDRYLYDGCVESLRKVLLSMGK